MQKENNIITSSDLIVLKRIRKNIKVIILAIIKRLFIPEIKNLNVIKKTIVCLYTRQIYYYPKN